MKALSRTMLIVLLAGVCGCSVPSKAVKIYFYDNMGKLASVERDLSTNERPVVVAIDQLFKGPNEQESANGLRTMITAGTRARNVAVEGDTAIIDLNSTLGAFEGGTEEAKGMIAQIVYTATDIRKIKQVILKLQGSDQFSIGPGLAIDHPLTREDVKD